MKYMMLIYTNENQETAMSDDARNQMLAEYGAFSQEAVQRNMLVSADELQPTSTATTVKVRDGKQLVTDGPFAESVEVLGGYYLLDCKDMDEAIEMAAKIPGAQHGGIEIRPVVNHG